MVAAGDAHVADHEARHEEGEKSPAEVVIREMNRNENQGCKRRENEEQKMGPLNALKASLRTGTLHHDSSEMRFHHTSAAQKNHSKKRESKKRPRAKSSSRATQNSRVIDSGEPSGASESSGTGRSNRARVRMMTLTNRLSQVFQVALYLNLLLGPLAPVRALAAETESALRTVTSPTPSSSSSASVVRILFIGDSLTAGYGVKREEAFPEKVGELLRSKGYDVQIVNGGISGSVTAEADRRLKWYLKSKPDVLVLALGANDALKGTPPDVIKRNLATAIDLARAQNVKVLLVGMRIFENFGPDYSKKFEAVYRDLAREKKVAFLPFLLEPVALRPELNQSDRKHPNAKGHELIARHVAEKLEAVLGAPPTQTRGKAQKEKP
jgi:acyl-CoA thioesterase-1